MIATADLHEEIGKSVEVFNKQLPARPLERLESYSLSSMSPAELQTALAPVLGDAKVSIDASQNRLLVWSDSKTHQEISDLVQTLGEEPSVDQQKVVMAYGLEHVDATNAKTVIDQIAGDAMVLADVNLQQLVVTANLQTQANVKSTLAQIDRPSTATNQTELKSYDVRDLQASTLLPALQAMWPSMQITVDPTANKLLVTGSARDQEALGLALDQLLTAPEGEEKLVKTYPVPAGEMATLPTILGQLAPRAIISSDTASRTVTVWASPNQQQRVQQAIEQIAKTAQTRKSPATYMLQPSQVIATQTSLKALFPTVSIAADVPNGQLIVVANEDEQAQIADVMKLLSEGPNAVEKAIRVFRFDPEKVSVADMSAALQQIVPERVSLQPNVANDSILVIGLPAEIEQVAEQIEGLKNQVPPIEKTKSQIYRFKNSDPNAAARILATLVPAATLAIDPTTKSIAAMAVEEDHAKISEFVTAFDVLETEQSVQTYPVPAGEMGTLQAVLVGLAPGAIISSDVTSRTVTVWASAAQHQRIQAAIEQVAETAQSSRLPASYSVNPSQLVVIQTSLSALFPSATISADPATGQLIVIAPNMVQTQIAEVLKMMSEGTNAADKMTRIFTFDPDQVAVTELFVAIQEIAPEKIRLQSNPTNNTILAIGLPEDLDRIAKQIEDLQEQMPAVKQKVSAVYQLQHADSTTALTILSTLVPKATLAEDRRTETIAATATAEELDKIAEVIEQIEQAGAVSTTTRFYALKASDARALSTALAESFPTATITADPVTGGIYAAASPEDHLKIEEVVRNVNEQPNLSPQLKAFVLRNSSPEVVAEAVDDAFGRRSTAGVSFDKESRTLFVVGTEDQLRLAEQLVEQIDRPTSLEDARQLRAFSLRGVDGKSVTQAVETLFDEAASSVDVQYDIANEQLLVTAETGQLKLVEETLKQFTPPERELRIIKLQRIDPYTFQTAVESLFEDEPEFQNPQLTIDYAEQQVFVRATSEQLKQIDNLILQLGESNLANLSAAAGKLPSNPAASSRLRFIPVSRNPQRIFEELQRLWPTIRQNPLKIVDPTSLLEREPSLDGKTPSVSPEVAPKPPAPAQSMPEKKVSTTHSTPEPPSVAFVTSRQASQETIPDQAEPSPSLPPVIVVTGEEQWTLASDDTEALDQLERLLDAMLDTSIQPFASTGNYSIYVLHHAGAEEMQNLLSDLFGNRSRSNRSSFLDSFQQVRFVADARTNTLIMSGSRSDREVVEELLGVLDSEDFVDTLQQISPTLIPLENATAENVLAIIQDVYRSQLSAGAGRRPVAIPEGVSTEVATVLQQINAQTSGPLLTLAIDENTNSIVMRAPNELSQELQTFIERLDQQAKASPSRRVELIRLQSTNAENLQRALRILMSR